jgi:hypothetical protein
VNDYTDNNGASLSSTGFLIRVCFLSLLIDPVRRYYLFLLLFLFLFLDANTKNGARRNP